MLVAGLNSGTSANGIDCALVEISGRGWRTRVKLRAFASFDYPRRVRQAILDISDAPAVATSEFSQLNFLVGELFARALLETQRRARRRAALAGSHGQTIYHQGAPGPCHGFRVASTWQIGEPAVIAARAGLPVVADFRTADVAAGGQGAPLVPYLDYLLFRHPQRKRVALNIGGIANVTIIPAGAEPERVIAYDTGPGNMVVDALTHHFTHGRQWYDRGGRWAARGRVHGALLARLLRDRYFRLPPPKTAGREQFGRDYLAALLREELSPEDLLATATALTAESIARGAAGADDLIAAGGGVGNRTLMQMIADRLPHTRILKADDFGIPSHAKECVLFALLAYETWHHRPSNIPSATGAAHPVILGKISHAP
jgi:anhydro-N-acetylmuramic acid kinase